MELNWTITNPPNFENGLRNCQTRSLQRFFHDKVLPFPAVSLNFAETDSQHARYLTCQLHTLPNTRCRIIQLKCCWKKTGECFQVVSFNTVNPPGFINSTLVSSSERRFICTIQSGTAIPGNRLKNRK